MARAIGLLGTNTAQGCSPGTAARTCTWGFVPHPTLPGRGIDPRRRSGITVFAKNFAPQKLRIQSFPLRAALDLRLSTGLGA
jgi:hypothetical protein